MAISTRAGPSEAAPCSTILTDTESGRTTIASLTIADDEVTRWLADQHEGQREAELTRAIRVGVMALKAVTIGATIENVRAEFAQMREELNGDFDRLFGERGVVTSALQQHFGPDGTMAAAFEEYVGADGKLAQQFAEALGEDGEFHRRVSQFIGPDGELSTIMEKFLGGDGTLSKTMEHCVGDEGALAEGLDEVFGEKGSLHEELERIFGPRGDLVYNLLNPMSDETPLGKFRIGLQDAMDLRKADSPFSALKRDLDEIKTALRVKEAVNAEAEKGTAKGASWQDALHDAIANIALSYHDSMEDVGNEAGRGGRVGDQVVLLNTTHTSGIEKRIVFEAKNKPVAMKGKDSIWRELDEARTNRDASFAVVAVNAKHRPAKAEQLQYSQPNKAIIVYVDEHDPELVALEAAYAMARTLMLAEHVTSDRELSPEKILHAIKRVNSALDLIKGMKHSLTSAVTSIESVKESLDGLRDEVSTAMTELADAAEA